MSEQDDAPSVGEVGHTLEVRGLEVRYGSTVGLTGVSLDVPRGSSLAVIGPNGSGKSTLLRAIAGIAEPAVGSIRRPRGGVAFVLQSTDVDRSLPLTVRDAVAMGRFATRGMFAPLRAEDRRAVDRAMEQVQIADLARRQIHDLSGGQRQRAFVAQGLAQDAPILLLDEPVSALDVASRQLILDAIDAEREAGRIVIATTHDLGDARRCDQVLLVDRAPIAVGPPSDVLCAEHLSAAFGGRFLEVGGKMVLDDPHHEHPHHPHPRSEER